MSAYDDLLEKRAHSIELAIEACPWKDTDHLGDGRYNYCTWCEGYVMGALSQALKESGRPIMTTIRRGSR